jgi:hypothetical protein
MRVCVLPVVAGVWCEEFLFSGSGARQILLILIVSPPSAAFPPSLWVRRGACSLAFAFAPDSRHISPGLLCNLLTTQSPCGRCSPHDAAAPLLLPSPLAFHQVIGPLYG